MIFRKIYNEEKETAYKIICDVTKWLNSRNTKQWSEPLPKVVFDERQTNNENYGLIINNEVAVFLSLILNNDKYWREELNNRSVY